MIVLTAILILTIFAIRAVVFNQQVLPWLIGLVAVTSIYLFVVSLSLLF
jgi:glycerol uptake facilitator-like aquaporin